MNTSQSGIIGYCVERYPRYEGNPALRTMTTALQASLRSLVLLRNCTAYLAAAFLLLTLGSSAKAQTSFNRKSINNIADYQVNVNTFTVISFETNLAGPHGTFSELSFIAGGAGRNKGGLQAGALWPMRGHDVAHTGRGVGSGARGVLKWKYATGGSVFFSPAIGLDGTVYVGSDDHNLYAIKPDGSLKWKYATGSGVESSPAIGSDGTVYVGSYDNNLYAIK